MKSRTKAGIAVALAFALWAGIFTFAAGCGDSGVHETAQSTKVVDYGNGVFYFPYNGGKFGKEFSAWRAAHPKWIIIAIAPDNQGTYGSNSGYYVIANPDL